MTTQSDIENKSIVAANANINKYKTGKSLWEIFQMGYLKGAEDSDLEWQAKVRELIEVTGDLTTAYLAGLKPLQSQIQRAFDVLRSLESLDKYQAAKGDDHE